MLGCFPGQTADRNFTARELFLQTESGFDTNFHLVKRPASPSSFAKSI